CRSKSYVCLAMRSAVFIKFLPARGAQCRLYHMLTLLSAQSLSDSNFPEAAVILHCLCKPTVSPLLILVTSRNILLLQSLPNSISDRQDNGRRRKDDTHVGTAARGHVERLSRFPGRFHADGGASGRVRGALSTGAGDRSRPTPHAPLPPGAAVPLTREECRGHRDVRQYRAPSHPRLHRHGALGSSALGGRVSWPSGRAVG